MMVGIAFVRLPHSVHQEQIRQLSGERVAVTLPVRGHAHVHDGRHSRNIARSQGRNQFAFPGRKLKPVKRRRSFVIVINIDRSTVCGPSDPNVLRQPARDQLRASSGDRVKSAPLAQVPGQKRFGRLVKGCGPQNGSAVKKSEASHCWAVLRRCSGCTSSSRDHRRRRNRSLFRRA